ncbi:MAG: hypothetical protein Q4A96_00335, partial [Candidatus Saccharibacteria bacterium]|nr:hypothetical protein [Candidatus Saccharibacteria bacterium]
MGQDAYAELGSCESVIEEPDGSLCGCESFTGPDGTEIQQICTKSGNIVTQSNIPVEPFYGPLDFGQELKTTCTKGS